MLPCLYNPTLYLASDQQSSFDEGYNHLTYLYISTKKKTILTIQ